MAGGKGCLPVLQIWFTCCPGVRCKEACLGESRISDNRRLCGALYLCQVLASIQLDATLASIKHEARHDGALADRLAHWKAVFREKGEAVAAAAADRHTCQLCTPSRVAMCRVFSQCPDLYFA